MAGVASEVLAHVVGHAAYGRRCSCTQAAGTFSLLLRRNYPYQGRSDGRASQLRKRHPDAAYVGIEREVNQRFVLQGRAPWESLRADLVESLEAALSMPLRRP